MQILFNHADWRLIGPSFLQVIRCLREHENLLTDACYKKIFEREVRWNLFNTLLMVCWFYRLISQKDEARDPGNDFLLMTACKSMIKVSVQGKLRFSYLYSVLMALIAYKPSLQHYCDRVSTSEMFPCLRQHKEDSHFDEKCKKVILLRERMRVKSLHQSLYSLWQFQCRWADS